MRIKLGLGIEFSTRYKSITDEVYKDIWDFAGEWGTYLEDRIESTLYKEPLPILFEHIVIEYTSYERIKQYLKQHSTIRYSDNTLNEIITGALIVLHRYWVYGDLLNTALYIASKFKSDFDKDIDKILQPQGDSKVSPIGFGKSTHPVWDILSKGKYTEEFIPKAEEIYDFIKSIVDTCGGTTMRRFFDYWNSYSSETFNILRSLVCSEDKDK